MKIGIISSNGTPTLAAFYGDIWVSVPQALEALNMEPVNEMAAFIERYGDDVVPLNQKIDRLAQDGKIATYSVKQATFLPPVPASPKLFTGRGNSACFVRTGRSPICKQPVMEQRYNFNLVGHNSVETLKSGFVGGGWNYEMVCVMGKPCHGVTKENAYDYVFGYVNMLDHSGNYSDYPYRADNKWGIPDSEKVFSDWAYEGCYNGNTQIPTPIGPYIVTKDEVGDPHEQMTEERESGRLVTYGSANAVCFTFDEMIAYMSSFMTLHPGDMMSCASITFDGFPYYEEYPENAYIQAKASKLGRLRLWIKDERKDG